MAVLRPQDVDLHNEDGSHIDPGGDRNLKARLKRHLERHEREELPEIGLVKYEFELAEQQVQQALEHQEQVRKWGMGVVQQHVDRGVKRSVIADRLGVSERTLYDWLRYGKRQPGGKRRDGGG